MVNFLCACVYNNVSFNIFQVHRLPVMPFHESSPGSPVLSLLQFIDKPSGDAQCSRGRVLQHFALNLHIARIRGPVSIFAAIPQAIRQLGRFGALIACTLLPFILADQTEIPDTEKMLKEGQSIHFNERYKDVIKTLLHFLEQKGWFDFETA